MITSIRNNLWGLITIKISRLLGIVSVAVVWSFVTGRVQGASDPYAESRFAEMSSSEIEAYEIDVLRRIANLALIPPHLNTSPLPEYDYDKLDYGMTLGIAQSPQGRLFALWVGGEDGPRSFMVMAKSEDDGETWSKPILVIDSNSAKMPVPRSVIVGNLWTDPSGRLWLFFDQTMNHFDGRGGLWAVTCEDPDAEELVWSEPRRIWHGSMLNKPTVLSNGDWLLSVQLLEHSKGIGPFSAGVFPELDELRGANVLVSSDKGSTWQRVGCVKFPEPNWYEHRVLELDNGDLWMLARTKKGIMQSFSRDGGRHWTTPSFPPEIKHPVARFHIRRLQSGRMLLVKHGEKIDQHEGRSKLSAWLSDDEGKSWYGGLMLDERSGVSYPDGFQSSDGKIYISYDRNRATDGEILLAKFYEEDVAAARLTNPNSRLKLLISRPLMNRQQ